MINQYLSGIPGKYFVIEVKKFDMWYMLVHVYYLLQKLVDSR